LSVIQDTAYGDWRIISPRTSYLGITYGEWARNWMNWLIRNDPDTHNTGPVVYIRGVDFKKHRTSYGNYIKIQKERLSMSLDQAALFAIMACFVDARHHPNAEDHDKRLTKAFTLVINGDYPPARKQFTIDGKIFPIELDEFLTVSPEFKLHVPPVDYGATLGQLLDVPMIFEGDWDCALAGYFVLLKPQRPGRYTIASNATAEDGYHTETLVEIEVFDQSKANRSVSYGQSMKDNIRDALNEQGFDMNAVGIPRAGDPSVDVLTSLDGIMDKGHLKEPRRKPGVPSSKPDQSPDSKQNKTRK